MMMDMFTVAFFNALVIFGINKATQYDVCHPEDSGEHCRNGVDMDSRMILWKIRFYCLKWFGEFWSKPLITCPPCMASFHSLYIYWSIFPVSRENVVFYPLYILSLSGLVSLINSVTKYGNS